MESYSLVRVLLVEDDEDDYLITRAGLSNAEGMVFDLTWINTYAAALEAIKRDQHDVYLIDYRLDEHDGLELLREAIAFGCEAPLILLTGIGDHAVDIEAMRVGAADYLIKDQISAALLARSIRHALQRADILAALRMAETRLRASVREKEILLQEVHHRVKNNLQIIKSLLRLQAYAVGDPALHELFRDSQNRVHAMALVHEQLYRAQDLAHVDCAAYLRELAGSVLRSYEAQSARVVLTCAIDGALALEIDTAIPLGLILTELVSNSLKHAFPADRTGTITVGLHTTAETLTLTECDDGVGLPATVDFRTTSSLGLQLVSDLTDQLGGAVTIDRRGGTAFQICIPQLRDPNKE
jgi:two-component sensor histidine kinase/CheY-like chemotaxis protein